VGDPVFLPAAEPGLAGSRGPVLAPLPGTRREVEAVAALFPQADQLVGADAARPRLAALEREFGRYDVVHLATHGLVNWEVALESALVLSQSADDDCRLTALHMRKQWPLKAELVVLSACESGLG